MVKVHTVTVSTNSIVMDSRKIDILIQKYLTDTATEAERASLLQWYRSQYPEEVIWTAEDDEEEKILKRSILNNILTEIRSSDNGFKKPFITWRRLAIASVVLVFLSTSLYFWSNPDIQKTASVQQIIKTPSSLKHETPVTKIIPGGNKAILILSNGSRVILDDAREGIISRQGNTIIQKTRDGQVTYNTLCDENKIAEQSFNTIKTPKGGMYQIILPDGTKVWMNAASSLKFPSAFNGSDRRVELTGEAYFEVAKNPNKPFKVFADHTLIEVLGTHFNVMAYSEENKGTVTTLIEGSVKIIKGKEIRLLEPGEQAEVSHSIQTSTVSTSEIVEWKNGNFNFANENIESIMNKISRWYNVEIEYQGEITKEGFVGTVSRSEDITAVLRRLEHTGLVHFKIHERRIIVMP